MNPWLALGVFGVSFFYDIVYVFFVRYLLRDKKLGAAALSGLMQALIIFEVVMYGKVSVEYGIPTIVGATVGTPIAMWLDDRLPQVLPRDKKTGRFKEKPSAAKIQPSTPELKPL